MKMVIVVHRTPHGWQIKIPGQPPLIVRENPVLASARLLAKMGVKDVEASASFEFH
jgi:hypothetical protein